MQALEHRLHAPERAAGKHGRRYIPADTAKDVAQALLPAAPRLWTPEVVSAIVWWRGN
jgi:hypothetical protein